MKRTIHPVDSFALFVAKSGAKVGRFFGGNKKKRDKKLKREELADGRQPACLVNVWKETPGRRCVSARANARGHVRA